MLFILSLVTGREPNKVKYSTVKCNLCVKSTKNLGGVNFSSTRAGMKVLASHVNITSFKLRRRSGEIPCWHQITHRSMTKHVNGTINHQLQKFTPPGLVSWLTVVYFAPWVEGGKRWGLMPLGLVLFRLYITSFALFLCLNDRLNIKF